MKKILFFLFITVFAIQTTAQNSNLTIFSEDGLSFYVILNGIRQNENPETNVRIDGLMNEYYTTKVIFADNSLPTIEKKMLMVIDADSQRGEATYKIKKNKKGEQILKFFSFTPASQVLPPPANVAVVRYNTAPMSAISFNTQITETTTSTTTNSSSESVNVGISVGGINIGANVQVNEHHEHDHSGHDHSGHNHGTHISHTTTTTTNYGNVAVVEEIACQPMERNLFQGALSSIEGQSFADSKLSQAKQITSSNCLNAGQIKAICEVFDFESTRLEFAKFAYAFCFDQSNYWQINDSFDFDSSVSELNDYIRNR